MAVIDLNTEPNDAPVINMEAQDASSDMGTYSLLDPDTVKRRAARISYATGVLPEVMAQSLQQGQEGDVRRATAEEDSALASQKRYEMITKLGAAKQGPLTPEDMASVDFLSGFNFPYKYPRNPQTIFEQKMGDQWGKDLNRFAQQQSDSNFWNYGQLEPRNETEAGLLFGSDSIARYQHQVSLLEDLENRQKAQNPLETALQKIYLGMPFPLNLPVEGAMRGNLPAVGVFAGGDVGSNLEAQRQWLNSQPYDVATRITRETVEYLAKENVEAAKMWLNAMMGQSVGDRANALLGSLGGLADVVGIGIAGGVGFSRAYNRAQIRKGIKDALKGAGSGDSTEASVLSGIGDTATAGSKIAAEVMAGRATGASPTTEAMTVLPANMNVFSNNWSEAANAKLVSQTFANNMIFETQEAIANGLTILRETMRPTVIDVNTLTTEQTKSLKALVKAKYGADDDSIVWISPLKQEEISKTPYWTVRWADKSGTPFEDIYQPADALQKKGFRVSFDDAQLADVDARILAVQLERKAHVPHPEDDVHGLNFYEFHDKRLAETEARLTEFRAAVAEKGGARIVQDGLGHYAEFDVPFRLQDRQVGQMFVTPDAEKKKSFTQGSYIVERARTSEDTLTEKHNAMRKAALYPQAVFDEYNFIQGKNVRDFLKGKYRYDPVTGEENPFWGRHNLKNLVPGVRLLFNKTTRNRMYTAFDYSQKNFDPTTKRPGWFMTPAEYNDWYVRTYHEAPNYAERATYETWVRANESQRWWTQVAQYRGQAQRGNLTHRVWIENKVGEKVWTPEFAGQPLDKVTGQSGTTLIVGPDIRTSRVVTFPETPEDFNIKNATKTELRAKQGGRTSVAAKENWNLAIEKGTHTYIKLDNPIHYPFEAFGKIRGVRGTDTPYIQYVLAPVENVERSALKWDSVPRTGGGRFIYDYPLWIKYPNMKYENIDGNPIAHYLGDHSLMPVEFPALGKDVVGKLNKTMEYIALGKEREAKSYYKNNGMEGAFEKWSSFRSKFGTWIDPEGKSRPAVYNTNDKFHLVSRGRTILDQGKDFQRRFGADATDPTYRNAWKNSLATNPELSYTVEFTQKRGDDYFKTITNLGSANAPIYRQDPARMIDPLTVLNRGMRSTVKSLFMDDYKTWAVNNFMREAAPLMVKEPDSKIFNSPFYHFKTLTRDDFTNEPMLRNEVNRLWSNKHKIDQFVQTPTELDGAVYATAQRMADWIYRTAGPRFANQKIVAEWALPILRDPASFIRSVTMNAYLGVFAPAQLLVQSMSYVTMFAISPTHAVTGTYGAFLRHLAHINPSMIDTLDKMATKMKIPGLPAYKAGEWLEAYKVLKTTGFDYVGREVTMMDSMHNTKIVRNGIDTFLEAGRSPFKWGEINTRVGAWFIAMKEFRTKNPTGRITDTDRMMILQRADYLYGNMSSASHSVLNSGAWSTLTQFYMYAARLGEIFWSASRLGGTKAERIKNRAFIMAVHGGLFGLPMAFGVTGAPVGDWLRKQFMDNGYFGATRPYVPGDNWIETWINEGAIASAMAAVTGRFYNIGPRYGLGGLNPISNLVDDSSPFYETLGGAAYKFTMNTFGNGLKPMIGNIITGNWQNITPSSVIDVFKEIKSVGDASMILYAAFTTGNYLNKNWEILDATTKQEAIGMFLTGARPTLPQQDVWLKGQILQGQEKTQKYATDQFLLNMNKAITAEKGGDTNTGVQFRDIAMSYLPVMDLRPGQLAELMKKAFRGVENRADRMDRNFFILQPAVKDKEKRFEQYQRQQAVKEKGYR